MATYLQFNFVIKIVLQYVVEHCIEEELKELEDYVIHLCYSMAIEHKLIYRHGNRLQ
jgi:hypothetical protein